MAVNLARDKYVAEVLSVLQAFQQVPLGYAVGCHHPLMDSIPAGGVSRLGCEQNHSVSQERYSATATPLIFKKHILFLKRRAGITF